ncbi:MAG: penicillin-binding transpeptidase domain-containing protein [Oscillospiraceae bacterium]
MEGQQFTRRIRSIVLALGVIFCVFFGILVNLQVVHGAAYAAQSKRKIAVTEVVPASRGPILDRYGRPLVTNRITYQVTLDTALMKTERDETLLRLLKIAKDQGVAWTDNLPVTAVYPYTFTLQDQRESVQKQFAALCAKMKWRSDTVEHLFEDMEKSLRLSPELTPEEKRGLLGILYELQLRAKEVTWSGYIFASGVDIDFISAVKEQGLAGVKIDPVTVRQYNTTAAPHILGRTGLMDQEEWKVYQELGYAMNESVGKDGAEKAFESWLRGTAGRRAVETNDKGKIVSQSWIEEPKPGGSVSITVDLPLQQKVEQSLKTHIPNLKKGVEGGAAVVVDVNTGGILASASYPDFDLSTVYADNAVYQQAATDPLKPFLNRVTQGLYSPGSTYKMVTAIGGLEEGIISPTTKILDTGKYMYYAPSFTPACWIYRQYGGTHGAVNVSKAIEVSCNVFFYDVGRRLGIRKLEEYAQKFGLGKKTGIEIPESTGIIAGPDYTESIGQVWYEGSVLPAAIGQENNQFTPLQLANYVATLVNGGHHYSTHLLQTVKSSDFSQVLYTRAPEELDTIDIAPENLAAVKKGMLALTEKGSVAHYFRDLDVKVGAKTGSAQVSAASESNAVFVCFAPYDDPQIAMAIVAEKGGSGGELGAIAADVLSYYFSTQDAMGTVTGENVLIR